MLNSIDLFSGIGGFALALEGYCKPLLYCDNSNHAQSQLRAAMTKGTLPRAPIVSDVRDRQAIRDVIGSRTVHVLTSGWPCVGWSRSGAHKGLGNEYSALFHDLMKVVRSVRPGILFFENVSEIMSANDGDDLRFVLGTIQRAGYSTIRWSVCTAAEAGAPQVRRRWFCLGVRKGYDPPPFRTSTVRQDPWAAGTAPAIIVPHLARNARRFSLLGNAIVPQAARRAFLRMFSGFSIQPVSDSMQHYKSETDGGRHTDRVHVKCRHGQFAHGRVQQFTMPKCPPPRSMTIIVDPSWYRTNAPYRKNKSRGVATPVTSRITLDLWPTPRATLATHSHNLSVRTVQDLPTTAMYAAKVDGRIQPRTRDGQGINPEFVEWLMGYPNGHTAF